MPTPIHCITLPVADIEKSAAFYREAFEMPIDPPGGGETADHVAIRFESGLYLVLVLRGDFDRFTALGQVRSAETGASSCILSHFVESKEAVDHLLQRAARAPGGRVVEASDHAWGYAGFVADPDGHLWEILWNSNLTQQHHTDHEPES